MEFGLVVFSAYYLYSHEKQTTLDDTNTVIEETNAEITDIRLGISNLDTLSPIASKNQNIQDVLKLVYEPLLNVTEEFKLENALAVEWSKAEEKVYLIKLRENVKWHNGDDFSANDVKFTIDTIKELGENYIYYSNVKNIENVEVVSNSIIRIYLYEPEPFFEYNLTFPIINSNFYEGENVAISLKSNIPMGTGMYKLQTVDVNSSIELKLNTNWWNIKEKTPKIDSINIKVFSSIAEVYNAYKLGGIDILNVTRNNNLEQNIGTIGYNVKDSYGRQFEYLVLNCES